MVIVDSYMCRGDSDSCRGCHRLGSCHRLGDGAARAKERALSS